MMIQRICLQTNLSFNNSKNTAERSAWLTTIIIQKVVWLAISYPHYNDDHPQYTINVLLKLEVNPAIRESPLTIPRSSEIQIVSQLR
jgi:hypothetical protein